MHELQVRRGEGRRLLDEDDFKPLEFERVCALNRKHIRKSKHALLGEGPVLPWLWFSWRKVFCPSTRLSIAISLEKQLYSKESPHRANRCPARSRLGGFQRL